MSGVISGGARRGGTLLQLSVLAYANVTGLLAFGWLVLTLLLTWVLNYAGGGSCTPLPHLFYIAIILGAVRFSWSGATTTAVAAGLLAGPALPADVSAGIAQSTQDWLLRLAIFLAVGLLVAWLLRGRSEPMRAAVQDAVLSAQLLRGLQQGEVQAFFQPVVDLEADRITGVEALARWTHPSRGPISPAEFVPAAERSGAVHALDDFVLRDALRHAVKWRAEFGLSSVSVNVSATRFESGDLTDRIATALDETGCPPDLLQVEVTESAIIADVALAAAQLDEVRRLGVRVAIDDFGAGEASLAYLSRLPVDTVKLDCSLVRDIATSPRAESLLTGVVELLHTLGLEVIAEGLENDEHRERLLAAGCRLAQGFHLGRPGPASTLERGLHQARANAARL